MEHNILSNFILNDYVSKLCVPHKHFFIRNKNNKQRSEICKYTIVNENCITVWDNLNEKCQFPSYTE